MKSLVRLLISSFFILFISSIGLAQEAIITSTIDIECGDIIEGEFTQDFEIHQYILNMKAGDQFEAKIIPIGDLLKTRIVAITPSGDYFAHSQEAYTYNAGTVARPEGTSGVLSANGQYIIEAANWKWQSANYNWETTGFGVYTLYIGCTLRDGTVIEPGDSLEPDTVVGDPPPPSVPTFSGFGFPGLAPVDFSEGVELPLIAGEATLAPIAGDLVALYSYDASAGSTATLSLSRASGDISIGVTVIHKDTNQIIFMGGMPFSDTLSVALSFPLDGTYVIGLFQLITAEAPETSGAVEILIE